jgi:hypothetical protein
MRLDLDLREINSTFIGVFLTICFKYRKVSGVGCQVSAIRNLK